MNERILQYIYHHTCSIPAELAGEGEANIAAVRVPNEVVLQIHSEELTTRRTSKFKGQDGMSSRKHGNMYLDRET